MNGAYPFVSSTGPRVITEAVCYRVFKKLDRKVELRSFLRATALLPSDLVLGRFLRPVTKMTELMYIRSIKDSRRKKAICKASKDRRRRGCKHHNYTKVNPFVKIEKMAAFSQSITRGPGQPVYVARLIQATHDETHLDTGVYFKPATTELKRAWHVDNWIFYASVEPDVLDYWINKHWRTTTSYFMSDYSAFDSTWSDPAFDMLESIYRAIFPDADEEFWQLLNAWRKPQSVRKKIRWNKKLSKHWLQYTADNCLASGRDDTALANALLNGLCLAFSFAAAYAGVRPWEVTEQHLEMASRIFKIAIVGDDSLVACSVEVAHYERAILENIGSFGLIAKSAVCNSPVDVTFLGGMPYLVGGRLYWGPTIGRRIYKAFWQPKPLGNLAAWTNGVALQLETYRHVPVLSDIARKIRELLKGYTATVTRDEYSTFSVAVSDRPMYDESTISWVCERYRKAGLTPQQIRCDLKTISDIVRLPAIVQLFSTEVACMSDDL